MDIKFTQKIPDESECLEIMKANHMLPNIIKHSIQVKNVSIAIASRLKEPSSINMNLVAAGALLHDIAKTKSIREGLHGHDLMGADMLNKMGLHSAALICATHVRMERFDSAGPLEECEIVHYADKRVKHDKIVSIEERIEDLLQRYGINSEARTRILENRDFVMALEKKIEAHMTSTISKALEELCENAI